MFTRPPRPQGGAVFFVPLSPAPQAKSTALRKISAGPCFVCFQLSGCALGEGEGSGVGVGSGVGSGGLMTTRSFAM